MSKALLRSLTLLLRQPDGFSLNEHALFAELESSEVEVVKALRSDDELNKYGNEQAEGRLDDLWKQLPNLFLFLEEDAVYDFWKKTFEPTAMRFSADINGENEYSREFLQCVAANLDHPAFTGHAEWLGGLLEFEGAILDLSRASFGAALRSSSTLDDSFTAKPFRVLKLDYEVAQAVDWAKNLDNEPQSFKPNKKTNYLLFVRNELQHDPDLYGIEKNVFDFLRGDSSAKLAEAQTKDLVSAGLIS